ncbi:pre-peptidase C-terminal domain-containing protein [Anthocerotibacter panamensis]|uniref:pre-peptidase C-terminal domain-containing protein n=1 Tax=Anthocerotibacter panamensis TaxID=2857077 RepID=UPI001C404AD1|nr:pre-peptidase C-terminal domain-containing protein [Anthocerotibacter panamensis]
MKYLCEGLVAVVLGASLLWGNPAGAATFTELEPNDSIATAQFLNSSDSTINVIGTKNNTTFQGTPPNDTADYYSFFAAAGDLFDVETSVLQALGSSNRDTILALYDPQGGLVQFDDDSGVDASSLISAFLIQNSGTYFVAVSGFGDPGDPLNGGNGIFTGGGDSNFRYQLQIRRVPEPATLLGLCVLGGWGTASRFKNKQRRNLHV